MLNYFGKKYNAGLFRFVGKLFVVIMFLCLNHKHGDTVVVDVVDDTVVGSDVARVGHRLSK